MRGGAHTEFICATPLRVIFLTEELLWSHYLVIMVKRKGRPHYLVLHLQKGTLWRYGNFFWWVELRFGLYLVCDDEDCEYSKNVIQMSLFLKALSWIFNWVPTIPLHMTFFLLGEILIYKQLHYRELRQHLLIQTAQGQRISQPI